MDKRFLMFIAALSLCCSPALAREQVRIVGSSSVFPFVAAAAEQFSRAYDFRTPIVESNGTGGGFKMFCDGVGSDYPDIANASRPIKPSELARCEAKGVGKITELKIGYDGIVIANASAAPRYPLSKKAIFLALARQVPKDGKLIENPYKNWREVDKNLPDAPIDVYGPPPAEGTRDAFVEMVMHEACKDIAEYKTTYPDESVRKQQCGAIREDGKFAELLGGNVMVQKLVNNQNSLGIFGYSFLDQNRALVKANPVDGELPTVSAIVSKKYPVARALYVYVKNAHISQTPGIREFVDFILSDASTGEDGFLSLKGLIPQTKADQSEQRARAQKI